jgi:opacity protein-like surface antigen
VAVSSYSGRIDLYQIPMMGNLILSVPLKHGFRPYFGAGTGVVASVLDFNSPLGNIRDTDYTFGYQAFAGFNYQISRHLEVGVGYKFLSTRDHGWQDGGVTFHTDGIVTHAITASLTWTF